MTSLGGVFAGGMPLAGYVTQVFRGGGGPLPPTLYGSTVSPSGPIGDLFVGVSGAPLGQAAFGGGAIGSGAFGSVGLGGGTIGGGAMGAGAIGGGGIGHSSSGHG